MPKNERRDIDVSMSKSVIFYEVVNEVKWYLTDVHEETFPENC